MTTTKTKAKPITKTQLRDVLRQIKAEHPERVNPFNEYGSCLYHKGRGRNITRCLVGEIGYRLGLPTPKAEEGTVEDVIHPDLGGAWSKIAFTDAAINYLSSVQGQADGDYGEPPLPWGKVKL
jgi:hypothetical protein